MALTTRQKRILNELQDHMPELRKGQLAASEQIKLGDILDSMNIDAIVTATPAAVATANADATYGQPEADLINEIKAQFNLLRTLVDDIRTAINNAA